MSDFGLGNLHDIQPTTLSTCVALTVAVSCCFPLLIDSVQTLEASYP